MCVSLKAILPISILTQLTQKLQELFWFGPFFLTIVVANDDSGFMAGIPEEEASRVFGATRLQPLVIATEDLHWVDPSTLELIQLLVEQGRISLDHKISRWFPHLLAADQVTVRMLVANTAGYIDYVTVDDFLKLELAEPFRTFTDEELINYSVRDGKINFPPGTSQQYSHTDNVILGQVIQRATKQSMRELYDRNIFGPMGMKDTQFPVDQEIQSPVLHAFTMDRKFYEDCTYWNPFWGSTPGLPTSNIHDVGKWGPILGTGRLISPAHFQEQIAPTSVGKGKNKPDLYFAYGFVVANGWIVQNPSINGYSGGFGYNLAKRVTIVVEATRPPRARPKPPTRPPSIFSARSSST